MRRRAIAALMSALYARTMRAHAIAHSSPTAMLRRFADQERFPDLEVVPAPNPRLFSCAPSLTPVLPRGKQGGFLGGAALHTGLHTRCVGRVFLPCVVRTGSLLQWRCCGL